MADGDPSIQFSGTGLQPPPKFDFGNPSSWKEWVYQFDDYCYASGLYQAPGEVQVRTLLYDMGSQDARRVLDTLALSSEDWSSLEEVHRSLHPPGQRGLRKCPLPPSNPGRRRDRRRVLHCAAYTCQKVQLRLSGSGRTTRSRQVRRGSPGL